MMREAPTKIFGIFFLIDTIWYKMVHNHDHAGVKWGGGERGAKYAEGGGRNSVRPPLVAPLEVNLTPL